MAEGDSPEYRFGSMVPDFAGMAGGRINRSQGFNRVWLSDAQLEIWRGIDFHYVVDQAYEDDPARLKLVSRLRNEIIPNYVQQNGLVSRLIATIGTDALLDGYLLQNNAELAPSYYVAMESVSDKDIGGVSTIPENTIAVVRHMAVNLPDYSDPTRIAGVIQRRSRQPKFFPDGTKRESRLAINDTERRVAARILEEYQPLVNSSAKMIIQGVQKAVASRSLTHQY